LAIVCAAFFAFPGIVSTQELRPQTLMLAADDLNSSSSHVSTPTADDISPGSNSSHLSTPADASIAQTDAAKSLIPDAIYYTVQEKHSFAVQAAHWGVPSKILLALNPTFSMNSVLQAGDKLCVFRANAQSKEPLSIGRASRGRLQHAVPMPEGEGYFLRSYRPRSWATRNTIEALITAFSAYAQKYPEGPRVNLGDLSKRRGGKVTPHSSHQSGRDVDFGLIVTDAPDPKHPEHFQYANAQNLDAEKSWFLIHALIKTGEVQKIYLDAKLQKLLYVEAAKTLNDEELKAIFPLPRHKDSASAIFQHWKGHKNHFHVRFKCPAKQWRCKS
jgi:murein endopeptidase